MHLRTKDGFIYNKPISPRQYVWYVGAKDDEREDVGLTIAATIFSEEILTEYLKRCPLQDPLDRIKGVTAVKLRSGNYGLRITLADAYTPLIEMSREETVRFLSLQSDAGARHDFLLALAVHHLTHADAVAVKERIKQHTQAQARVRILPPRPQDYTPEISRVFASTLANALSSLNVRSGVSGHNREHEVGHRTKYDDMDERQSGTRMSM